MPKITDNNDVKSQAYQGGEEALVVTPAGNLARVPFETLRSDTINYQTKTEMDDAGAPANGQMAKVWNDPTEENNGEYGWDGAAWVATPYSYEGAAERRISEIRKGGLTDRSGYQYAIIDESGKILFAIDKENKILNQYLNSVLTSLEQQAAANTQTAESAETAAQQAEQTAGANDQKLKGLVTENYDRSGNLFAIIDSEGRELLRIDRAGKLTAAGKSFVEATESGKLQLQSGSLIYDDKEVSERSGYILAFTDTQNRVLFGVGADGRVSISGAPDIAASISKLMFDLSELEKNVGSPEQYKDVLTGNAQYISAGPGITCWGDSMTAGAGGNGTTISTELRALTGLGVHNAGVGGESSNTIVARAGAIPFPVRIADAEPVKEIPASGPVQIQFDTFLGNAFAPLRQGNGGAGLPSGATPPAGVRSGFAGTLNGVPGYMYFTGTGTVAGDYYFQRSEDGAAVPMDRPPYSYRTDFSETQRDRIWIIWIGQNGNSNEDVLIQVRWMIDHMTSLRKKYLIIPRPTSNDTDDASFQRLWGRNVVCIRAYLSQPVYDTDGTTIISSYGLADAGITPTAQDITDIQNGKVPTSLRIDAVHFNEHGYSILARLCYERLIELKYI